jgi:hypothetical protein
MIRVGGLFLNTKTRQRTSKMRLGSQMPFWLPSFVITPGEGSDEFVDEVLQKLLTPAAIGSYIPFLEHVGF